ncbi:hypothetical protein Bca101_081682 [Brassica carinata]
MSFAPTKDAVATSVLSKRWLSLWTMVPRLTFEDYLINIEETNEVRGVVLPSHAVSGTLLLHKSPVIESFHLTKDYECSDSEIYLWVRITVDRFVRDLKISFINEHCLIRLPSRLFRCETLETLELHRVIFLDVPSLFSLRSLKTLRLRAVKYADVESFVRLITSSPLLENLVVHSCSDDNVETFTIDVPSLRSLTVWNTLQDSGPNYSLFVIHPHSLNHLDIVSEYGEVNVMGKMPKLVEANLHTLETPGNALESLAFAKRLSLTLYGLNSWNIEQGVKVCWIQPSCVPECLLFHLKTFEWIEYKGTEDEKEVAVYILKNARRLVTATVFPESLMVFEELEIATRGSRACELTMG